MVPRNTGSPRLLPISTKRGSLDDIALVMWAHRIPEYGEAPTVTTQTRDDGRLRCKVNQLIGIRRSIQLFTIVFKSFGRTTVVLMVRMAEAETLAG